MDWVYVKKWFMPNDIRHLAWSYTPSNTVFKIYIAKSNESINILFIIQWQTMCIWYKGYNQFRLHFLDCEANCFAQKP